MLKMHGFFKIRGTGCRTVKAGGWVLKIALGFAVCCMQTFSAMATKVACTLSYLSPGSPKVHVRLDLSVGGAMSRTFLVPRAVPMGYCEEPYDRFVSDLQASDAAGKSLTVVRTNGPRWHVGAAVGGEFIKQPPEMPVRPLVDADSWSQFGEMQHQLLILLLVVRSLGKLLKPGGAKALESEDLRLKPQFLIARRSRRRWSTLEDELFALVERQVRDYLFLKPFPLIVSGVCPVAS